MLSNIVHFYKQINLSYVHAGLDIMKHPPVHISVYLSIYLFKFSCFHAELKLNNLLRFNF